MSGPTGSTRLPVLLLQLLLVMLFITAMLLFVAHLALEYPDKFLLAREWLENHRGWLLAWRCLLYAAGYTGIFLLWRRHGQGYLAVLLRPALALTLLIIITEFSVWSRGGLL